MHPRRLRRRDERIIRIGGDASLAAGMVLIAVVLGAFVVLRLRR